VGLSRPEHPAHDIGEGNLRWGPYPFANGCSRRRRASLAELNAAPNDQEVPEGGNNRHSDDQPSRVGEVRPRRDVAPTGGFEVADVDLVPSLSPKTIVLKKKSVALPGFILRKQAERNGLLDEIEGPEVPVSSKRQVSSPTIIVI
jgi:hypothetical protein